MKIRPAIVFATALLIALNLVMAFSCIWIFMRMAPAIDGLNLRNERSLHACVRMLSALSASTRDDSANEAFELAFADASRNITEPGEKEALDAIRNNYAHALSNDPVHMENTVRSIGVLTDINRAAMASAGSLARRFCLTGAWCVVFMACFIFLAGLFFLRFLKNKILSPIYELHSVCRAVSEGDTFRRSSAFSGEFNDISHTLNNLLDRRE